MEGGLVELPEPKLIQDWADGAVADIGPRVVWARREAGLTQRALADRAGARLQMVVQWESGVRPVPLKQLELIAKATGLDIRWFLNVAEQHADLVAILEDSAAVAGDGGGLDAEPKQPEAEVRPAQGSEAEADLSWLRAELEEREKKEMSWLIEQLETEHRRLESHRAAETAALDDQRRRSDEREARLAAAEAELEERLKAATAADTRFAVREHELKELTAREEALTLHEREAVAREEELSVERMLEEGSAHVSRAKAEDAASPAALEAELYKWDLDALAALGEKHARDYPERVAEWRGYILYLSELADGMLLTGREADALFRDFFGPLLEKR